MAEWDAAYINDLPDSAFAVILPGGEKDSEGKTTPRSLRKLPHHNASGALDMPHLRNAMSREPQAEMPMAMHDKAHAHLAGHMDAGKAFLPVKATLLDDDAFRLLAIPFGGPVPYPGATKGADIEGQWFSQSVDIRPGWFKERVTDWHHGVDPIMGRTPLGKAVDLGNADGPSDEPDEEGWWVTLWLDRGQRRNALVRRLAERGAEIYGSSESMLELARMRPAGKAEVVPWQRGLPGEITHWPYIRQTLSTSPQNTYSVLRPMKAVLDNLDLDENSAGMRELLTDLYALGADLAAPSIATGELAAKAGRVLSAANERTLREALAKLEGVLAQIATPDAEDVARSITKTLNRR